MSLSEVLYLIGRALGFLALISLALLIFSGDTARFTDKYFGLDRIIKFQRKFSLFNLFFLIFHPIFFIVSGESFADYFIPNFLILPLALGTIAFYIFMIVMLCSYFYKKISYTAWQYIHVLTYILFFLSVSHAFLWGSSSDNPIAISLYIFLLLIIAIGCIYRLQYKIKEARYGKAIVTNIKWETDDVFSLFLKPKVPINFKAGQFCFLRLDGKKLYARHPFTIASSPIEKELLFSIKNTGRFTSAISKLSIGDEINIDGPFGRFVERNKFNNFVFIAGGIGITPFRSLIKDFFNKKKKGKIALLYFAKTEKDLVFYSEFENLKGDSFEVNYILSDSKKEDERFMGGYISIELVREISNSMDSPIFYICGPRGLKDNAKNILRKMKIPNSRIVIEDFFW